VAKQTVATFIGKASRLYEQERRAASAASPLGMYVRRWLGWANGGVWVDSRGPAIGDTLAVHIPRARAHGLSPRVDADCAR
jgi:hypothetical protein